VGNKQGNNGVQLVCAFTAHLPEPSGKPPEVVKAPQTLFSGCRRSELNKIHKGPRAQYRSRRISGEVEGELSAAGAGDTQFILKLMRKVSEHKTTFIPANHLTQIKHFFYIL
jgi:hypothetical protein